MWKFENSTRLKSNILRLENLFDAGDTGRAWENVENTKSQLKKVNIILNWSSLNHGFMKDIQNF
jgi:hypothetical protein